MNAFWIGRNPIQLVIRDTGYELVKFLPRTPHTE